MTDLRHLPVLRRFLRYLVLQEDGCLVFIGGRSRGYGQFWDGQKTITAHRFAYLTWVGPVPDGLTLDHLCQNRSCVRWDHLEPCARGENVRRALHTGWCKSGRHPLEGANLVTRHDGRLECRLCANERRRTRELAKS